jgi:hypothetical protein
MRVFPDAVRPFFREWSLIIDINYRPDVLAREQVERIIKAAGVHVGLGAWRPKYGRFDVEVLK